MCYQKALEERRKNLIPIDFSELRKNQQKYMNLKLRT